MSKNKPDWEKRLSHAAKAEMLVATIHLLTDHMPKVWKRVPAWLRAQIKQAMADCSIEYKEFAKDDLKLCNEYGQWLNEKHPQPGSTLAALLKKRKPLPKRPRYLHYAIVANNWKDKVTGTSQIGCMEAENKEQATSQLYAGDDAHVERTPKRKCPVCNEK
jgi:hypothetical protein